MMEMSDSDDKKFQLLQEHIFQEQAFFWQRFSAFSALHAGLLVLATSNSLSKVTYVHAFGFVLGIIWVLVQWASLHYVDRTKEEFYNSPQIASVSRKKYWLFKYRSMSSTNLALYGAVIVAFLWTLILMGVIT